MNTHGITEYSERMAGTSGNHGRVVRCDVTDGYLGITAWDGEHVTDRVLLSPDQAKAVLVFYRHSRRVR